MSRDRNIFVKFVRKIFSMGVNPYFISLNSYQYVPYTQKQRVGVIEKKWKRSSDGRYLYNQIQTARKILEEEQVQVEELCVTEWNATNSSRDILNDSCFKGAYIIKSMISTLGCADKLGYWTMLDVFSEHYDSQRPLDGSGGILTRNGIYKPAYYAFDFIARAGKYLVKQDENGLITSDGYGNYYVVCHNCKNIRFQYYLKSEEMVKAEEIGSSLNSEDLFENYDALAFEIELEGVENGMYRTQTSLVNERFGSVIDEWKRMGEPENAGWEEIEYLKRISVPQIFVKSYQVNENKLKIGLEMEPNEIRFIKIMYMH